MKRYFALSLFTLLIALQAFAQDKSKFSVGPEIGFNLIPMESKVEIAQDFQLGIYGGLDVQYKLGGSVYLSSGIYASQKRQNYQGSSTRSILDGLGGLFGQDLGLDSLEIDGINLDETTQFTGNHKSLFLQIPVLVNASIGRVSFSLGPYAGFLVHNRKKQFGETTSPFGDLIDPADLEGLGFLNTILGSQEDEIVESTTTEGLNQLDFGAIAGIGYRVNNLMFKLNYQFGIPDYREDRGDDDFRAHRHLSLSMAYLFELPSGGNVASF